LRDAVLKRLTEALHRALVRQGQSLVRHARRVGCSSALTPPNPQVDHSPFGATAYFRIIISAPNVRHADLARVLDDMAALGAPLWPALATALANDAAVKD
jgi:hypothetical protein